MTFVLCIAVLAAGAWLYSRRYLTVDLDPRVRSGLTALRLVLLALLGWWVFQQPTVRDWIQVSEPARAVILLDDSLSMARSVDPALQIEAPPSGQALSETPDTRWSVVSEFLRQTGHDALRDAGMEIDVRLLSAPDVVRATGLRELEDLLQRQPESPITDIHGSLAAMQGLPGDRQAQVLLFSDGRQTSRGPAPGTDPSILGGATYWTFGVGPEALPQNAALTQLSGPDRLRTGAETRYEIHGRRDQAAETPVRIRVELSRQAQTGSGPADNPAGGVVWATDVVLRGGPGGDERVTFGTGVSLEVPDEPGRYVLGATITLNGDRIPSDDHVVKAVEVVPARDPVLLLTGQPTWELRYLKRALEDDPTLDVTAGWWREGEVRWFEDRRWAAARRGDPLPPEPPNDEDLWRELDRWSVIVLHRLPPERLDASSRRRLAEVLEDGGRVLLAYGRNQDSVAPSTPFGIDVLGPTDVAFTARVSTDLNESPLGPALESLIGKDAPPLEGWYGCGRLPAGARKLIVRQETPGEPEQPVVVEVPVGLGRAVLSLTESLWRWELPDGRGAGVWRFLIHRILRPEHLVPDQLVIDPLSPEVGDTVVLRYDLAPSGDARVPRSLPVRVETPQGPRPLTLVASQQNPGRLEAEIIASVSGSYRVVAPSRGVDLAFTATFPDRENLDITQDRAALERLANRSGGAFAAPESWPELIQRIDDEPHRFEIERQRHWASRWWVILLIAALLGTEWWWRQKEGLP